jgi:hypothetical protein
MKSEQELRDSIEKQLERVRYEYERFKARDTNLRSFCKAADEVYDTISGCKYALGEEWNLGEFNRLTGFIF